jgi:hypothetical protein
LESLKKVPNLPLIKITWNKESDAFGKPSKALRVYKSLLKLKESPVIERWQLSLEKHSDPEQGWRTFQM